jgi:hypothetical protein
MIDWTRERLLTRSNDDIKSLRENAAKRGEQKIVELCDDVLLERKLPKKARPARETESKTGQYVSEFHFVCPGELGVTKNPDGTIWSGTWVVAKENAVAAEKYGSIVALHSVKAELSYIQGIVKGWRKSERARRYTGEVDAKTPFGIDFLLAPQSNPIEWKGDGSGEKGYSWSSIP